METDQEHNHSRMSLDFMTFGLPTVSLATCLSYVFDSIPPL